MQNLVDVAAVMILLTDHGKLQLKAYISPYMVSCNLALQADVPLNFVVNRISINRNGSAILLAGLDGLRVMYLYGRSSTQVNTTICRTVSIGSDIYFNQDNVIRTLQISWHPYSDTHIGILSSDSVFRYQARVTAEQVKQQPDYQQQQSPRQHNN